MQCKREKKKKKKQAKCMQSNDMRMFIRINTEDRLNDNRKTNIDVKEMERQIQKNDCLPSVLKIFFSNIFS